MKSVWMKFRSALQSFRVARAGNVAITFAFATIPIVVGIGSAVDYSKANQVKVAMQAALDSTALMISKEAAKDSTDGTLQNKASSYFNAMFRQRLATSSTITANYYPDGGTRVVIDGAANVSTSFLGLIGVNNITVSSSSTVRWGSSRLRVALVLDNTGSMQENDKIVALRTATANLLTQLKNAAQTDGDVYVSIIPFMKDVNLGPANWNSDWIYWGTASVDNNINNPSAPIQDSAVSYTTSDTTSWNANNGTCSSGGYTKRSSCLSHSSCSISGDNSQSSCTGDGTCSLSGFNTSGACTGAGTCSLSSYTSQSTCTGAGTCSLSGHTNQTSCIAAGTCSISGHNSSNGCTSAGTCSNPGETDQTSCTGTKACTKSQYGSKNQCQNNGGVWGFGHWTAGVWTAATWTATPGTWTAATWTAGVWSTNTWTPYAHNDATHGWNGCVMDRGLSTGPDTTNNYDTNVAQPDVTRNGSLYAAEQYSYCSPTDSPALNPVMGLNYNWDTMNTLVSVMAPGGSTNQAIGLQLGWMSLVGVGPFTAPPKDPNYTYTDVIILLTDGLNTQDRWYGDGSTLNSSDDHKIDAREQATCDNINAGRVTLYTIQVNTGHDATSTLLQNCAGTAATSTTAAVYPDPSKFFLLTSADAIVTTFQSIGTKLSNLYVAQ